MHRRTDSYPGRVAQIDLPLLRSLVERTRTLLGADFEVLYAKHTRGGPLSRPHRLIVLVLRVQAMIQSWERHGSLALDDTASVTVMELSTALRLLEAAREIPAFARVGATVKTSDDYAHTLVMLSAVWFLEAVGNGRVEFVPTADSPMPDLRVRGHDGAPLYVEVYVPRVLVHPPQGLVPPAEAADRVERALRRKKRQLRSVDSLLLIGGLGCSEETVEALKAAAEHELARRERSELVGVAIFAPFVVTEFSGAADAPPAPRRLHNGSRTAFMPNPRYRGRIHLRTEVPPAAPLVPVEVTPHRPGPVPILT